MLPQTELLARAVSRLCGWIYVFCWSLSFYPQPYKNYRRRTTRGLMPDFPLLNVVGFVCYTISTAAFLLSPTIRTQYAARHPVSPEPTVRGNDLAFGLHACVLVIITYSQFFPRLWGWKEAGAKRSVTRTSLGLVCGSITAILVTVVIVCASGNGRATGVAKGWEWIDVIYAISYVKLLLTVFKYIPQMIENYRRKSTVGWSIWQVLLDFIGGFLSLAQLVIDSALQGDWSGLTGNPLKLGLANVSVVLDIVFILQHYVLYGEVEESNKYSEDTDDIVADVNDDRRPLLSRSRRES